MLPHEYFMANSVISKALCSRLGTCKDFLHVAHVCIICICGSVLMTGCAPKEVPIPLVYTPAVAEAPPECLIDPGDWKDLPEKPLTKRQTAEAIAERKLWASKVVADYRVCQSFEKAKKPSS